MSSNVVIFDFDGVIADSFQVCLDIHHLSIPDLSETEYRQMFDGDINKAKTHRNTQRRVDFFGEYDKRILHAPLVEGIREPIVSLADEYTTVIVSSTTNKLINKFLKHHNLRQCFQEILGNDVSESKTEKFKMIFKNYNTMSSKSVFITDTLGDLKEANEMGIKSIAVTWGYQPIDTLKKGHPTVILDSPEDIAEKVQTLLDEKH